MAKFIKKRFPALFVATYFIVAASMVGFLIYPALFGQASVAANFTNNGAATATWGPSYADRLVMDVTIPDAWNGVAYTADTLYYNAGTTDAWQGGTLNAFPALGTTSGIGYVENAVDVGFQTTESVVADLDADSVVTTAADDLIDGDGSAGPGEGTVNAAAAAGDPLTAMGNDIGSGGVAVCTDSLAAATAVRIDLDGDCTNNGSNDGTYVLGTLATAAAVEATALWAFGDPVTMGGNGDGDYDDGEDIFIENNIGELTYSAATDGVYIVGAGVGATISDFPADCDGAGAGTQACKYSGSTPFNSNSNIYIDGGTAGGAAPNSVVDRQEDSFRGLGVQNTGTAVATTDIAAVEVWADAGAAGFQGLGIDVNVGVMTVNSGDTKEWRVSDPGIAVLAGGHRFFVTVDLAAAPTNGRTLKFQIPTYNDAGADGVATSDNDRGVFMGSNNDGPTDAVVLNANTETIDSAGPTVTSRVTADSDGNGKINRIIFTVNENLDDDFIGLTIDITGYVGEAYVTGSVATDNIFWVNFTEGASMDTDAIPNTQITANTTLSDAYGNNISTDGVAVAATDGAAPVIENIAYKDNDGDGKIDRFTMYFSETVAAASFLSANDFNFGNVGDFTGMDFGADANDLITGAVASADVVLGTESTVIDTRDNSALLAVATQNAFSLTDGVNTNATHANQTQATYVDGAAPVLDAVNYSPQYLDLNSNGSIEIFQTWWSENVSMAGSTVADWTIVGGDFHATFASAAPDAGGDQVLNITVSSDASRTGSSIAPTIAYDNDDANNSITDASSNPAGTTGPVTLTDGAASLPVSAAYKDADGNGTVDRIDVTMTAEASISCTFQGADWSIPTAGTVIGANTPSACVVSGNDIQVTVAATADKTGGGTSPTINYSNIAPKGSVTDGLNQTPDFSAPVTATDGAAPIIVNTYSADPDNDGDVNAIDLAFSEDISDATVTVANFEFDNDSTNNSVGEETASGGSSTVVYPAADLDANDQYYRLTATTGINGTDLAYLHMTAAGLQDAIGNSMTTGSALGTENDEADPIVVITSPLYNATDIALDATFSISFSEPMTQGSITGAIARSPSFSLGSPTWLPGDLIVSYPSHDPWAGLQVYSITLAGTIASAASGDGDLDLTAVVPNPFSFTTVAATSGGGGGGGLPASVMVMSPNGGEVWAGLSSKNITWSSTSSTIAKVKLFYSLDRGVNFPYTIATNENNDGTYSWTVPNIPSGTVKVKVEGYDESGVFVASDISDADFTITYTTPPPAGEEIPSAENPAGLVAGDLLKSPMSTTVYYYGSDSKRHIFPNEKTYKSWYPDWSNVKSVTAEELRAIPLGKNVTVRPGTVLVKIYTDSKTYAVESGGLLRWIPTESRIKILYGDDWAKKIIDVPLAFWGDYSFGTDISADTHPTGALVQYPGTIDVYYIQGAEKRKVTTAGFIANNFRSEYVLAIPATISYANGADISGAEGSLISIY